MHLAFFTHQSHVIECSYNSFMLTSEQYSTVQIYIHSLIQPFIHSPADGHYACFQLFAIIYNTAVNILCAFSGAHDQGFILAIYQEGDCWNISECLGADEMYSWSNIQGCRRPGPEHSPALLPPPPRGQPPCAIPRMLICPASHRLQDFDHTWSAFPAPPPSPLSSQSPAQSLTSLPDGQSPPHGRTLCFGLGRKHPLLSPSSTVSWCYDFGKFFISEPPIHTPKTEGSCHDY